MRRRAAAAQNSTPKKQRQDFVYTKQIKYLQIWAPKTPIKQIKYGSAPSSTNQIKYGLPYLIDLFVAECALRPLPTLPS